LVINAVPAAEAGAPESTRDPPTQNLSSEHLERSESSPNRQAHSAILARDTDPAAKLFSAGETMNLRSRWESIQVEFVDEPKRSVKEADQLVAAVPRPRTHSISAAGTLVVSGNVSQKREKFGNRWPALESLSFFWRAYASQFFYRMEDRGQDYQ